MQDFQDPDDDFRNRFRYILGTQRSRRPLALLGIALAITGLILGLLQVDVLMRPSTTEASTHPGSTIFMILLGLGILSYRPQQPTPVWRYAMSGTALSVLIMVLGLRLAQVLQVEIGVMAGPLSWMTGMGSDTALILALLFASAITRRHFGRIGLGIALVAVSILMCDFIALSFGENLFEGQMAVSTLLALTPLVLAVLTLYAHRPFARGLLLSGPVGYRTRMMLGAGVVVPWIGGMVLHRLVGVPDRMIPVEAVVIGIIILSMCAVALISGVQHEHVDRERRKLGRELRRLAIEDQLTGVLNRNGIKMVLRNKWARFREWHTPVHVILFDLDHFKQVNDSYGHDTGDRVLATVGALMQPLLRPGDALGRWGGEEFLVITDAPDLSAARILAERLCAAVARNMTQTAWADGNGPDGLRQVTASFGVAAFGADDTSEDAAIKRADLALYQAKENGRNQVCLAEEPIDRAA